MDHPATTTPATAREIILEIVRNMREGLEPLHFSILPPSVYLVYLHPDDYERLRPILPRVEDEAKRALDDELARLNRASLGEKLKLTRRSEPKVSEPDGGWRVRFLENTDEETQTGDIVIYSELALPAKADLGSGSMTRRISTRRLGGTSLPARTEDTVSGGGAGSDALATIDYDDDGGHKQFHMTKDQIVIGRGGRDYWTDLKLETVADVSREHVRLRRDPANGQFFLKDLSRLGTTINGERVPSSIEFGEDGKRDKNMEVPLPARARIGLAGVIFLDFKAGD